MSSCAVAPGGRTIIAGDRSGRVQLSGLLKHALRSPARSRVPVFLYPILPSQRETPHPGPILSDRLANLCAGWHGLSEIRIRVTKSAPDGQDAFSFLFAMQLTV